MPFSVNQSAPVAAVVGGGISGLAALHYFNKRGARCVLVEQAERLGGVIQTGRVEGCVVEAGPDSFLSQKPWAFELIRELGLQDQVIASNDSLRKTYVVHRGGLAPLPEGVQFLVPTKIGPILRTPLLSARSKLLMAAEWFRRPARIRTDRSVAEFVIDHFGHEANEVFAQPMLAGVYGGSPEGLSIQAVLPRFAQLEREYGSVSRGLLRAAQPQASAAPSSALFSSLKQGMGQLTGALERQLNGRFERVTARAEQVFRREGRWVVRHSAGEALADAVVLALPAYESAALLCGIRPELSAWLQTIPYGSSITLAYVFDKTGFERALDGFGFLAPRREKRLLAACTWVNTKFDWRASDDRILLRAFIGGDQASRRMQQPDDRLAKDALTELQELMGFQAQPVACRVFRWSKVMPQYQVDHLRLVSRIREFAAELPGLILAGNGYDGIGIPDCIRLSRDSARELFES